MNNITGKLIQEAAWDEDVNGKRWEDYETIVCPDGEIINMENLIEEQYRAMAALTHIAPAFGGFVSKLKFIYTFRIQTQATDGFRIFVNPQFTSHLDLTGKVFVMAHEIMHCLLNHMRRAKEAGHTNMMKSNIAADYEVNATLVDIGLFKKSTVTGLDGLYDEKYVGLGYETIYDQCSDSGQDSMDNEGESKDASNNSDQSQSGSGGGQPRYSGDFKAGWAKAMEDYKAGKLKI